MEEIYILALCGLSLACSVLAVCYTTRIAKVATRALNTAIRVNQKQDMVEIRIQKLQELIPEDIKEERARRNVLMSQINDEMEKRLEAERMWNETVNSILNYNVNNARGGERTNG